MSTATNYAVLPALTGTPTDVQRATNHRASVIRFYTETLPHMKPLIDALMPILAGMTSAREWLDMPRHRDVIPALISKRFGVNVDAARELEFRLEAIFIAKTFHHSRGTPQGAATVDSESAAWVAKLMNSESAMREAFEFFGVTVLPPED